MGRDRSKVLFVYLSGYLQSIMNNETSTIKKILLNLAKSINCEIYKNSSNNCIIKGFRDKN